MEWIEEQEPPAPIPVEDMEKANPVYEQNEAILQPWIDPHKLKKVEGTWYKDGRLVVTDDLEHKRTLIQSHHDPPGIRSSGDQSNYTIAREILLVAPIAKGHCRLCSRMRRVPKTQSQHTSYEGATQPYISETRSSPI